MFMGANGGWNHTGGLLYGGLAVLNEKCGYNISLVKALHGNSGIFLKKLSILSQFFKMFFRPCIIV